MSSVLNAPPAPHLEPVRGPIGQQRNIGKQILLFAIPWYVKCQSALNEYWGSKGAPAAV